MRSTTLALALGLAALTAAPADARIAFTASGSGRSAIVAVDPGGGGRSVLVADAQEPSWSPDGQRLAFTREAGDRDGDILTADATGAGERRVTSGPADDRWPAWSPPGDRIAFVRQRMEGERLVEVSIHVIRLDGTGDRKVSGGLFAVQPAWSPDGRRLAFSALREDAAAIALDLWVVNSDGSGLHRIASDAAAPAWSPDGRRIAFASGRDRNGETCFHECAPSGEIYVMNADGTGVVRLTNHPADDAAPDWSPDGTAIAFTSDRHYRAGQSYELHVMRADGSCTVRITAEGANVAAPDWRPGSTEPAPCEQPPLQHIGPDLGPLAAWRPFALFYLGTQFRGLALSEAQALSSSEFGFSYRDCLRASGRCRPPIEVQVTSICRDHPLRGGIPAGRFVMRRALVSIDGPEGPVDISTGSVNVRVFGVQSRLDARRVVATLRPAGRAPRLLEPLPAPAFPRRILSQLRRIELTVRRHGIEEARRRLRLSRSALRDRVRLARLIRSLPRPTARQRRAARC